MLQEENKTIAYMDKIGLVFHNVNFVLNIRCLYKH